MSDWKAHIVYQPMGDRERLYLFRRRGDHTETLLADGTWRVTLTETATPSDVELPEFPTGALAAIAEAVKPGLSDQAVAVLREALDVERARVDRTLER